MCRGSGWDLLSSLPRTMARLRSVLGFGASTKSREAGGICRIPGLITAGSCVGGGSGSLFHAKLSFPFFKQKPESPGCGV